MAVIITDMDMPKSCVECDKRKFNKCYINGAMVIEHEYRNNDKKIHPDCPMKSVDGLIQTLRDQFADEDGNAVGEYWKHEDVIEIIKEYCGMED